MAITFLSEKHNNTTIEPETQEEPKQLQLETVSRDTMGAAIQAFLGISVLITRANAQSAASCPRDSTITGYSSIEVLNSDMESELQNIQAGSAPAEEYTFRLCPETVFDTTTTPLRPVLNNAMFVCGENGERVNGCTFIGGSEQIRFENSAIEGYVLQSMSFMGLSFADFEGNTDLTGASIGAYASSQLTATFSDVAFTVRVFCVTVTHRGKSC